jgi:hypothetical protein
VQEFGGPGGEGSKKQRFPAIENAGVEMGMAAGNWLSGGENFNGRECD